MIILLTKKYNGARQPIKKIEITGNCDDYFKDNNYSDLNEELLINSLPEGFLPLNPDEISVMIEDYFDEKNQRVINTKPLNELSIFKEYDSEFDKYILELCKY